MKSFNFRYFLTRFAIAALLTVCIVFALKALVARDEEMFMTSTDKFDEQNNKPTGYSRHVRFGSVVSETWKYRNGRKITNGIGEIELVIIEAATTGLIFIIVFSLVPVFLKRRKVPAPITALAHANIIEV